MTDLKYSPLTPAVRDAVVAWLDTDPLMARLTAGNAGARELAAAYEARLPAVLAAALRTASIDNTHDDALANRLAELGSEVLGHGSHDCDSTPKKLERQVAYLERWLPQTVRERCERAYAVGLEQGRQEAQRGLHETIVVLREQLASEVRSSQAASAIADELSIALEKSREQFADLEGDLHDYEQRLRRMRDLAFDSIDSSDAGEKLRQCAIEQVPRKWIEHDRVSDLRALRDAARTLLPEGSTPNPATSWLCDVIRSRGERVAELERLLAASRAAVDQRDAWLTASRATIDGLRDRMADPEGMTHTLPEMNR